MVEAHSVDLKTASGRFHLVLYDVCVRIYSHEYGHKRDVWDRHSALNWLVRHGASRADVMEAQEAMARWTAAMPAEVPLMIERFRETMPRNRFNWRHVVYGSYTGPRDVDCPPFRYAEGGDNGQDEG